jgi:hypothetical protein
VIKRAIKASVAFVVFSILLYFFFFVPLGRRTLYEHVSRIAATDEAQELGDEVETASDQLEDRVREEMK